MLPTKKEKKRNTTYLVFPPFWGNEDLSENPSWKSPCRKAPRSRGASWGGICGGELPVGAILSDPASSYQMGRQFQAFLKLPSNAGLSRNASVFPLGLLTNCASHHWLKSNSSPISKTVSSQNAPVLHWNFCSCLKSCTSLSLYSECLDTVRAPFVVISVSFSSLVVQ